jgi:dienelactone hydrolase
MSQETRSNDMTKKTVVYEVPGMDAVTIRRDVAYEGSQASALSFDLYQPADARSGERRPVVVFVSGYPDPGFEAMFGCKFKDMGAYVSWARLVAASGLVAVTYTNREPVADLAALLAHLRQQAEALGIDESRIGIWACSGNVPAALSVLTRAASVPVACAALCYGYLLDLDGATAVAQIAARFRFANPCAGASIEDLRPELPLFLVRAGRDEMPALNQTMDRFVAAALAHNLPVTLANHATAPHAFDLVDDGETSREMIRRVLAFLRFHLLA